MQWTIAIILGCSVGWIVISRCQLFRRYFATFFLATAGVALAISMIGAPDAAFASAIDGLKVWWEIVFPALLPFFIGSELLMGLGVVNFMGVILEPLMRPLFNVPGAGSFVMAMGLASGYPIGAILTRQLRQKELCNRVEAERLLSFCNTADPLFMVGAVAIGMFSNAKLGAIIAIAHYVSSLLVGLCLRFYRRHEPASEQIGGHQGNMLVRALKELYRARKRDARPLGQLLGDAVKNSVNSLLMIGGFIILFSVIMRMATVSGLVALVGSTINGLLALFGLSPQLGNAAVSGIFEITIGCNVASQSVAPLMEQVILTSAIIAWSGFSVHAQVAAIINDTDIRLGPYLLARILQAVLAGGVTWLLWDKLSLVTEHVILPVFLQSQQSASLGFWWHRITYVSLRAGLLLSVILVLSLLYHTLSGLRLAIWRRRS
ncbi:MAG TPA: sporulation integral membrane protein YlbJ [Firmicutes bacterium]|nr:sporulation integral membrane protein YlbJ [Bacillota bacterium]